MRLPIFPRMLAVLLGCSLLPLLAVLGIVVQIETSAVRQLVTDQLNQVAELQKNRLMENSRHGLESLALLTSRTQLRLSLREWLRSGDTAARDKVTRIINDARASVPRLLIIDVVELEGEVVASTTEEHAGTRPYEPAVIADAVQGPRSHAIVIQDGRPILRTCGPLVLDGEAIGVIIVDSDITTLAASIYDYTGLGETGETLLAGEVSGQRVLLLNPRFDASTDPAAMTIFDAAFAGPFQIFGSVTDYRGQPVIAVSRHLPDENWALIVKRDSAEALAPVYSLRTTILIVGLIVTLAVTGVAVLLSQALAAPIARLAAVSRRIQQGELDVRSTDDLGKDEIAQLGRVFNSMADLLVDRNRHLAEQVAERTAELTRSNRDLEQFASVASHDLQTPIRNVASAIRLLHREMKDVEFTDKARRYMDSLEESSSLMQAQVEGLLTFSRVSSRGGDTKIRVELSDVVSQSMSALKSDLDEVGVQVDVGPLPAVLGDAVQLRLLMQNLISNAVKYRVPERAPCIQIRAEQHDGEVVCRVTDNGIGIADKFHNRVFEVFRRLHHQQDIPGTGIGLALCRRIVERHGGEIELSWSCTKDSDSGQSGSEFRFTLAAVTEDGQDSSQSSADS